MAKPLIKVCGVTRVSDAVACAELGVDLVGLNFHPPSPRYLEVEEAGRIADAVRGRVDLVGVFVNHSRSEVEAIDREVGLDYLQFHGDEPAAEVRHHGARAIRVFRVDPAAPFEARRLAQYPEAWGFLFDVASESAYGGGGRAWPYERIAAVREARPTLVAGGVTPETARAALAASGAAGVDVCSGVERTPGIKDRAAIERLVAAVRAPVGSAG